MPLIEETQTIRRCAHGVAREQLRDDPLRRGQVDLDHRVPLLLGHPPQRLVTGDAGVVDDHIDAAVVARAGAGDLARGRRVGDVERRGSSRRARPSSP